MLGSLHPSSRTLLAVLAFVAAVWAEESLAAGGGSPRLHVHNVHLMVTPELTLEVTIAEQQVEVAIGPVDDEALRSDLNVTEGSLGLGLVLDAVVDGVGIEERDGTRWLRLAKRVPAPEKRT